jgi:anti-anti-sigma regulatory factor
MTSGAPRRQVLVGTTRPDIPFVVDASALPGDDLAVVDRLARLQLAARRLGGEVRLRAPAPDLLALLRLVGLADVLVDEARRQAEVGEELGEEEVVDRGDAAV